MKIHEGKCTEKILKERERIGSRLAILRKKRNMTQEELANLCGVNRVNIAKIEKGAYNVSIDILSKVTSALGFVIDIKVDSSVCPTHFSQRKPVKLVIGKDYYVSFGNTKPIDVSWLIFRRCTKVKELKSKLRPREGLSPTYYLPMK